MSSEQKFNCILCKDVFDCKEELQVHFRKHGDPKFNGKKTPRFPNDSKMSADKPSEKPMMVGCDVCSEVFPTISKAITHKHKVHPDHDAKYFCPWCGKLFTMKHLYNKHMQSNHNGMERPDDKDFHCDPCDVDFYIPSAIAYHNKFFHRQDTDMPDVGQSNKFKLHNQEVIPLFYCAFCGEEYDNKVNLLKHMSDDHGDENQSPDEVLRCPLCEAIFYHLDAYEIHITFHSSEDLYSKTNEAYSDLQEFSLESLSPIVEKVENFEPQEDVETTMNSVGIDKFLELAMDQSQNTSVKGKKHKKHKKSKKSAITLDEFLSMNQDVFGEGLDFQGIEEVPTRVVKKRLKPNKKVMNTNTKTVTPVELEKLKQQGIVIKKKVTPNPPIHGIKVLKGVSSAGSMHIANKSTLNRTKSDLGLNTSDEMLSKLMSQSNNAIKIVKKSAQDNTKQGTELSPNSTEDEDTSTEKINEDPTNISESEPTEEDNLKDTVDPNNTNTKSNSQEHNDVVKNSQESNDGIKIPSLTTQDSSVQKLVSPSTQVCFHENETPVDEGDIHSNTENPVENEVSNNVNSPITVNSQNALKSLNALQNKGHIVIKPMSSDNQTNKMQLKHESDRHSNEKDNITDTDEETNFDEEHNDKIKSESANSTNKSMSVLKHLSRVITVKPVNQTKTTMPSVDNIATEDTSDDKVLSAKQNTKAPIALPPPVEKEIPIKQKSNDNDPTLDALKSLSKNITIKSLPKHIKSNMSTVENELDDIASGDTSDEDVLSSKQNTRAPIALPPPVEKEIPIKQKNNDNDPTLDAFKGLSKNIIIKSFPKPIKSNMSTEENESEAESDVDVRIEKEVCSKTMAYGSGSKNPATENIICNKNESKLVNSFNYPERSYMERSLGIPKTSVPNSDNNVKNSNADILKRLTNITTKPVAPQKVEQIVCMPTIIPRKKFQPHIEGEIETFNIDDSDDEDEKDTANKQSTLKPIVAFQNLNKNMTVKSVNQQCIQRDIKIEKDMKSDEEPHDDDHNTFTDDSGDEINNTINTEKTELIKTCSQKFSNRGLSIKNALKTLSKNIIVKSRNSSPSLSNKSQDHSSQDSNMDANEGSDSDSNSGKVNISEMNESDDEVNPNRNIQEDTTEAIVQSPDDFGSDDNEELYDFDNEIKANTLQKSQNNNSNKNPMLMNTLKNLGKNITIKSLSDQNDDKSTSSQDNSDVPSNLKKQLAIKPFTQPTKDHQSESVVTRSPNVARAEHSTNKFVNRKMSSSNQVNTVNKEVTVKTFQTKTVIQEITTTVTKTIKTVNQTMKQEIRNSSQTNSPFKAPFKAQGMRLNQPQNLQGVIVRNATPVGTRISNPMGQVRPAGTPIRPSKSTVPMRPGLNTARPSAPRMPINRKAIPAPSPQKHVIGKPLKIAPNAIAMAQSIGKRPNSEEMTGPFSCFKKPKESLIPASELPNASGELTAQHASSSHTSCSNFTSTTKVVKGNSVVTSTQMKSEMSASAQQISRLSNNIGLKIVKTSQAKQMQTQEKSETNAMKPTTLAAIERLQKQGLLVKKPRLDVNEDSENSEQDDEHFDYSSSEEQNT